VTLHQEAERGFKSAHSGKRQAMQRQSKAGGGGGPQFELELPTAAALKPYTNPHHRHRLQVTKMRLDLELHKQSVAEYATLVQPARGLICWMQVCKAQFQAESGDQRAGGKGDTHEQQRARAHPPHTHWRRFAIWSAAWAPSSKTSSVSATACFPRTPTLLRILSWRTRGCAAC